MSNVFAIVPARGGSEGIPLKNLREIDGRPLVSIAAGHGLEAETIDHTIVNSDHPKIRAAGKAAGAEAMDRPERFAHDDSTQEVDRLLQWCVEQLESEGQTVDVVVLLYPTAPLRTVEKVDEAVRMVVDGPYDSVLSLYEDDSYHWAVQEDETVEPTNYDPPQRGPRQNEEWNQWTENLAVYVVDRDTLMVTGVRVEGRTGYVEMPRWRSVDIDEPADLHLARLLWRDPPNEDDVVALPEELKRWEK